MATAVKHRRGTNTLNAALTGQEGEFTYNKTTKRIEAHDGVKAGGYPTDYTTNVMRYGAKGDGVTDDTAAIVAAITAALDGTKEFAEVVFPAGTYLVNNIPIPYVAGKSLLIRGMGRWSISGNSLTQQGARLKSTSAVPIFQPANGADGHKISNLVLDGNGVGTYGFYGAYGAFTIIEDCLAINFVNDGFYSAQGLCQLRFCYSTANGNGATWAGDGRVIGCWLSGNTGYGLKLTTGGTFVQNNECAFNGSHGIWVDGSGGSNNSNHNIVGNYVEDNVGAQIYVQGQSTGNRNCNKVKIAQNYVSMVHCTGSSYGIRIANASTVQIETTNLVGAGGNNANELQGIHLTNVDTATIVGVVGQYLQRNVIKLVGCDAVTIANVSARDVAYAATAADDSYGIYIDTTTVRVMVMNVSLTDYRGPGYLRGIKSVTAAIQITNYRVSTPIASPDSLPAGTQFMGNESNGDPTIRAKTIAATGAITATGTITSSDTVIGRHIQGASADGSPSNLYLYKGVDGARCAIIIQNDAGGSNALEFWRNGAVGYAHATGNFSLASNAPASAGATGKAGTIAWDANYFYVCVADNTWKRVAIATW